MLVHVKMKAQRYLIFVFVHMYPYTAKAVHQPRIAFFLYGSHNESSVDGFQKSLSKSTI
jgi:hypothetical protein